MKVSELIEKLKELENQDTHIVVRGYEGGYDDVEEIREIKIIRDYYTESYYGDHEELGSYNVKRGLMKPEDAVLAYLLDM